MPIDTLPVELFMFAATRGEQSDGDCGITKTRSGSDRLTAELHGISRFRHTYDRKQIIKNYNWTRVHEWSNSVSSMFQKDGNTTVSAAISLTAAYMPIMAKGCNRITVGCKVCVCPCPKHIDMDSVNRASQTKPVEDGDDRTSAAAAVA